MSFLVDINLPDMDGYAVMQCLRENPLTQSGSRGGCQCANAM